MATISIVKGNPISKAGGNLNQMALDYMAYPLIGTTDENIIGKTLHKLWQSNSNRFSHQYAYEAKVDNNTVGLITCYPVTTLNKLALPTFFQLIKLRKFELANYALFNLNKIWAMATLHEGRVGEYHISTLATLPESRGHGIGTKLIHMALKQAKINHCDKCSLTVKKENFKAIKLYQSLGFKIADSIEKSPYHLYRMVKTI